MDNFTVVNSENNNHTIITDPKDDNLTISPVKIVKKIIEVCNQSKDTIKKIHQRIKETKNNNDLSKKMNTEIKDKLSSLYRKLDKTSKKLETILSKYNKVKSPEEELHLIKQLKKEIGKFNSKNSPIKKFNELLNSTNV